MIHSLYSTSGEFSIARHNFCCELRARFMGPYFEDQLSVPRALFYYGPLVVVYGNFAQSRFIVGKV
jgi:hypothetical protein